MQEYNIFSWNILTGEFEWEDFDWFPSEVAALMYAVSVYGLAAAVAPANIH